MEIGELKNHVESEMDKLANSYKFLATFVEKAEAEIMALKEQEKQNEEFIQKYNRLTVNNKNSLNIMMDSLLKAQKNATTADSDGEYSGTQKGTPSLQ
jgi:hypothetical protein